MSILRTKLPCTLRVCFAKGDSSPLERASAFSPEVYIIPEWGVWAGMEMDELWQLGWKVVRFGNDEVLMDVSVVEGKIRELVLM
jgi:hypothetical protein